MHTFEVTSILREGDSGHKLVIIFSVQFACNSTVVSSVPFHLHGCSASHVEEGIKILMVEVALPWAFTLFTNSFY